MTRIVSPFFAALALWFSGTVSWAQTARPVIGSHPRLLINDSVPDTWEPAKSRLAAVTARALAGGAAQAITDFSVLRAGITSASPLFGNSSNEDANLNLLLNYALAYQIYHKSGQDSLANPYAAAAWAGMTAISQPVYSITSIVTDSKGIATVTFLTAPNPRIPTGVWTCGIWGVSNDAMDGPVNVLSVPAANQITYPTGVPNAAFSNSGMLGTAGWISSSQHGEVARMLSQWAYLYDWCYDWLVANGHDAYARSQIEAGYWTTTLTRGSSQWSDVVREADFHNYTAVSESAVLDAGVALYGDDALGATILNEGVGYFWEGVRVQPADCCSDTFEYNLKKSAGALTHGAMNWEGPAYWRAGTIRFLRAIEGYDAATARRDNLWVNQFPKSKSAGMYKVYLRDPSGQMANFGDEGNGGSFAGRDNFGMAILNDRFPDPHFVWMMTNSPNDWNSGDSGETGLVYKLIFFPYVNGPGTHDPSDLPLAAQFGPDVILRSGWGANDTFITYTSSLRGAYHRHDDAGSITVYKQGALVLGQPYTLVDPAYSNYNRRTIGGNTLTVYDPSDCWKTTASTCGLDAYGAKIANDGGQLYSLRRYRNQMAADEFSISRDWSGAVYEDAVNGALYEAIDPPPHASFRAATGYEHIVEDLTPYYVNLYSGSGDNPHAKVAANGGVVRELVHFQPTYGTLDPLVVFDQVTSAQAAFKKSWNIHFVNAPTVGGVQAAAGDTTYTSANVTQVDNGGRLYVSHLLPAARKVRAVGGNACAGAPILGATIANPAVYYAPGHGLQAGEAIGLATGTQPDTGGGPYSWPNWLLDRYFGTYSVGTVVDADHFTLASGYASNSTGYLPWSSAFLSGTGAPGGAGAFAGQVYYQTDASNGDTVWQWFGNKWVNLALAGYAPAAGYHSPVIYTHAACNWSYYVDQFGPQGSSGAHLWNESMDSTAANLRPNWMLSVSPGNANLTDVFLNVLTAAASGVPAPVTRLITSGEPEIGGESKGERRREEGNVYGVEIDDANGAYVAVFPASAGRSTMLAYRAAHAGPAMHVAAGLERGVYLVTQNGREIATVAAGSGGSGSFSETGGGEFRLTQQPDPAITYNTRPSPAWRPAR